MQLVKLFGLTILSYKMRDVIWGDLRFLSAGTFCNFCMPEKFQLIHTCVVFYSFQCFYKDPFDFNKLVKEMGDKRGVERSLLLPRPPVR